MIISYCGNGKGKTTAALGLALRAAGAGKRVKIIQFIKGDWKTGEEALLKKIKGIDLEKSGLGFVNCPSDRHHISEHKKAAEQALDLARDVISRNITDVVILDEINWAISEYLIKESEVIDLIKTMPKTKTVVLTGAPVIKELIELSDLVTEMKKIKHPYDSGQKAIRGIDF